LVSLLDELKIKIDFKDVIFVFKKLTRNLISQAQEVSKKS